ncbi:Polygalacturonase [Hibiscus syriacus]|uniref:Polygalacturonase n=1 Tax=Hibiscus syriacus TaxID=106335 RepID=A0A6A3C7X5_HIBSY|nr:Polygalacturonase [Hibiscus syriacus]
MEHTTSCVLFFAFVLLVFPSYGVADPLTYSTYNVLSYGAKPGNLDSTKAMVAAWTLACGSIKPATIYVPPGRFSLRNVVFRGQCKNNAIVLRIDRTFVAPSDYNVLGNTGNWHLFKHVNGVSVYGGILDGQGTGLWACKRSGKGCPSGATHIVINGCNNVKVGGVRVSATGNSPNTDGSVVQASSGVTILNSRTGTGNDCVSVGPGTNNLLIESVACGPGNGISIGSLGKEAEEPGVQNVTVKTITFAGRIIKIRDFTYRDIHGISATEVAANFDCSPSIPCTDIKLEDVKLIYRNKPAEASCSNADGTASGATTPWSIPTRRESVQMHLKHNCLSAHAGPITCGKPILRSAIPSLCTVHFQKTRKNVNRALKKANLNVSSSSKLAPMFHVIVAEYVHQIQAKRRAASRGITSKATIKEECPS